MKLPPRPLRRVLGPLLLLVCFTFTLVLLPVLTVVAAIASLWMPGRFRAVRLLYFALVGLTAELVALIAAATMWVVSGFGWKLHSPRFERAHYHVLRVCLGVIVWAAQNLFRLRLETDEISWSPLDDGVPGSPNAMIVLSRHAGPGDSLLLMDTLMNRDHLREPRVIMKDTMQADPVVDVYFHRLPGRFIDPTPATGAADAIEESIADLASDLDDEDALLVFPEGGNFTPQRRTRAIRKLRQRGHVAYAERAEEMKHVLPPKPGGVSAAMDAAPHADVVFVAHTGLEHILSARDAWREIPVDKTLYLRWWFYRADEVPGEHEDRLAWLYARWEDIDSWIAEHRS
ncbi:MAG: lysophospholipid acyltransferase family protein [Nocardioidaceae bacterium]